MRAARPILLTVAAGAGAFGDGNQMRVEQYLLFVTDGAGGRGGGGIVGVVVESSRRRFGKLIFLLNLFLQYDRTFLCEFYYSKTPPLQNLTSHHPCHQIVSSYMYRHRRNTMVVSTSL